ncbi:MAG: M14 family zinc carboxypeptidase, partial [Clostridiaceae bacterium]
EKITYGESGQGRPLVAHKIGNGTNSLVMVCAVHGYEDNWDKDGIELVNIGHDLISALASSGTNGWSVYVIPCANPDGLSEGYTNNGPGRCTIVGGVDINRDFPVGFTPYGIPRYWTNSTPLSVPESSKLSEFIQGVKNNTFGEMVVIDLHGWQGATIGNPEIGQYFINQFGFGQRSGYGNGYLIAWANSIGAKAALIELPQNTYSHDDVVNNGYSQKLINSVTSLIEAESGIDMQQLSSDAQSILDALKIELGDFKLNQEYIIYNGPIHVKYEFGLQPQLGSGDITLSVKDGVIESIELATDNLKVVAPIIDPIVSNFTSIAEEMCGNLGVAISNGTIDFKFNLAEQTIEIEVAKEYENQKLYTMLSIGFNDIPEEVVTILYESVKKVAIVGAFALVIFFAFSLTAELAGAIMLAMYQIITALSRV